MTEIHGVQRATEGSALPLKGSASSSGSAVGRFRVITCVVVVVLLLLDAAAVVSIVRIATEDGFTNAILSIAGFTAVNLALLMPLAQMWLSLETDDASSGRSAIASAHVITVVGREGPVHVRVEDRGVDVTVG